MIMKITTWNVNGFASNSEKADPVGADRPQPDVLCLQEIKARPEQVADSPQILPEGVSYWNPAQRPGYSGVALFTRSLPKSVQIGLG